MEEKDSISDHEEELLDEMQKRLEKMNEKKEMKDSINVILAAIIMVFLLWYFKTY